MGTTWAAINNGLPENAGVQTLAIDPTNPSTLYAGTDGGGVFKSTDMGATWVAINNGLIDTNVLALAIDPTDASTLYAGTDTGGGVQEYRHGSHLGGDQ